MGKRDFLQGKFQMRNGIYGDRYGQYCWYLNVPRHLLQPVYARTNTHMHMHMHAQADMHIISRYSKEGSRSCDTRCIQIDSFQRHPQYRGIEHTLANTRNEWNCDRAVTRIAPASTSGPIHKATAFGKYPTVLPPSARGCAAAIELLASSSLSPLAQNCTRMA